MNWRSKWQDKTRGGSDIVDIIEDGVGGYFVMTRRIRSSPNGLPSPVYERHTVISTGVAVGRKESFNLLPITPPAEQQGEGVCPCELADAACSPQCPCVNEYSSAGCLCCCRYGSEEQRKNSANRLVKQQTDQPDLADIRRDAESKSDFSRSVLLGLRAVIEEFGVVAISAKNGQFHIEYDGVNWSGPSLSAAVATALHDNSIEVPNALPPTTTAPA